MRALVVVVHRYVGLAMAGFLVIAGLTGTALVWHEPLDAWLNPDLFDAHPPSPGAEPLDPLVLRERVAAQFPQAFIPYVPLQVEPGRSVAFRLLYRPAQAAGPAGATARDDQAFVDPYSGSVLGTRRLDALDQGRRSIMPFVYRLHYALALGEPGRLLFGIVALLWTVDSFAGLYLTLPARGRGPPPARPQPSWWRRWRPAWLVRWTGGSYKLNFDLHRAGSLWMWPVFLVLAWSSVAFNLHPYYDPVMRAVLPTQPEGLAPHAAAAAQGPAMSWHDARDTGRRLMRQFARARGLAVQREELLAYQPALGQYRYAVRSDRDIRPRGLSSVTFDARSGALRRAWLPTGEAIGDTVDIWIKSLHKAEVQPAQGLVQAVVAVSGLACAVVSVTGVVIWLRKRRARRMASAA